MKLVWTSLALEDLESIRQFVEPEDARAARAIALRITGAAQSLVGTAFLGRPGRVLGTRELFLTPLPYFLVYRVTAGVLEVLRVLHLARRWPDKKARRAPRG
jgi:toxin ParE1/3/4